jgi:hypothetical protein
MEAKNITQLVTARIIQMMDRRGFVDLFWEAWQTGHFSKQEEAYESIEQEYTAVMGRRRYSNFHSFKRRRDE